MELPGLLEICHGLIQISQNSYFDLHKTNKKCLEILRITDKLLAAILN